MQCSADQGVTTSGQPSKRNREIQVQFAHGQRQEIEEQPVALRRKEVRTQSLRSTGACHWAFGRVEREFKPRAGVPLLI